MINTVKDKIQVEMKALGEIDSEIISFDSQDRKRKIVQEYYTRIKDIESGCIDVNDDTVLEELSKLRENAPKRIK